MEFYRNAVDLRHEMSLFLRNEKNVPKKWRALYTVPILKKVRQLLDDIVEANAIYPYTVEMLAQRHELQSGCIIMCEKLFDCLQELMEDLWWETLHKDENNAERRRLEYHINRISELLSREEILLKGWKKRTKLLQRT